MKRKKRFVPQVLWTGKPCGGSVTTRVVLSSNSAFFISVEEASVDALGNECWVPLTASRRDVDAKELELDSLRAALHASATAGSAPRRTE